MYKYNVIDKVGGTLCWGYSGKSIFINLQDGQSDTTNFIKLS